MKQRLENCGRENIQNTHRRKNKADYEGLVVPREKRETIMKEIHDEPTHPVSKSMKMEKIRAWRGN